MSLLLKLSLRYMCYKCQFFVDIDPEDMNFSIQLSGMNISDEDDEMDIGQKQNPERKHIVYQSCLMELFNMVLYRVIYCITMIINPTHHLENFIYALLFTKTHQRQCLHEDTTKYCSNIFD